MSSKIDISILLPTRGRTAQLDRSVTSLIQHADHTDTIEWLLAFDEDDQPSVDYFQENIASKIEESGGTYTCMGFAPLGYTRLNEYLNALAPHAQAPWWVFWNDDAVMMDDHWDSVISSQGDRFCIQAFDTHKKHPYSIFPIVPRTWWRLLGHLSEHPLNDAYISQIAWMLDIMVRIDIRVEHERFDLTGKNLDDTFRQRNLQTLEGDPRRPTDFNYIENRRGRINQAIKIFRYLESHGQDMSYFRSVLAGKQDPWEKMLASDVNKQMMKFS